MVIAENKYIKNISLVDEHSIARLLYGLSKVV